MKHHLPENPKTPKQKFDTHRYLINFDYDGVLVDSFEQLFRTIHETQNEHGWGRPLEPSDFTQTRDLTFPHLADRLGIPKQHRRIFLKSFYQRQSLNSERPALFPGIIEMLSALSRDHCLNVITANIESAVSSILSHHGAIEYFNQILGAERKLSKCDNLLYLSEYHSVPPERIFMVGDAFSDIAQGKQAGVRTIAVTWGYQSRELLTEAEPDFIASTPSELQSLFND